jgi:hypothetical protein
MASGGEGGAMASGGEGGITDERARRGVKQRSIIMVKQRSTGAS